MDNRELQAIVLAAGKGSRMNELTCLTPKCLLPVVNKPMVYYSLLSLVKANFQDAIVVVSKGQEDEIKDCINGLLDIKLDFFAIPSNEDFGTADTLRALDNSNKIKTDFIVVSCDLITDFPLIKLINYYRLHDASLTSLISNSTISPEKSVPGYKIKNHLEKDLIGIDRLNNDRLVFLSSEADFEEELPLSLSMLKKCPCFEIYTNYLDCHVYILKKWTLKYLQEKTAICSIKNELLPCLIRKQFKVNRNGSKLHSSSAHDKVNIFDLIEKDNISKALERLEIFSESDESVKLTKSENVYPNDEIKCYAFISTDHISVRANQIITYFESNKQWKRIFPNLEIFPSADSQIVTNKKQIGSDCVIGFSSTIKEKTSIKKSIIGNNCTIGEKVKITNCLIMDEVTIHDNCSIQSSILCKGVEIGKSADIKECIIAGGQLVSGLVKLTNEVIRDVDHLLQL